MFKWNFDKEIFLKQERNIDFSEITRLIESGEYFIVDVKNQVGHPNQKMYVVNLNGYPTCVPFVEEPNGDIFSKNCISE